MNSADIRFLVLVVAVIFFAAGFVAARLIYNPDNQRSDT